MASRKSTRNTTMKKAKDYKRFTDINVKNSFHFFILLFHGLGNPIRNCLNFNDTKTEATQRRNRMKLRYIKTFD